MYHVKKPSEDLAQEASDMMTNVYDFAKTRHEDAKVMKTIYCPPDTGPCGMIITITIDVEWERIDVEWER
jgi:hypothetical protein